ncbi:hypothetical protein LSAT2_018492 [Lamellibrachia satsuma]|nr:hypothetical protein LSAT2_018492 [Lamellibrachia satsuma]
MQMLLPLSPLGILILIVQFHSSYTGYDPDAFDVNECRISADGRYYTGQISTTVSGRHCMTGHRNIISVELGTQRDNIAIVNIMGLRCRKNLRWECRW